MSGITYNGMTIDEYHSKLRRWRTAADEGLVLHLYQLECRLSRRDNVGLAGCDADGDQLSFCEEYEFPAIPNNVIRVQIPVGISQIDAVRGLKKLLSLIEAEDPKAFDKPSATPENDGSDCETSNERDENYVEF